MDNNEEPKKASKDELRFSKAVNLIWEEIQYAKAKWESIPRKERPLKDAEKPVEFWLAHIRNYLHGAERSCYRVDKTDAMLNIRIIAALCVRAMMYHNTPPRMAKGE